jgi:hypothetical protein
MSKSHGISIAIAAMLAVSITQPRSASGGEMNRASSQAGRGFRMGRGTATPITAKTDRF